MPAGTPDPTETVLAKPKITRRHFPTLYPREMEIPELKVTNPFKNGSPRSIRYESLRGCATVGDALDRGLPYSFLDIVLGADDAE